MSKLPPFTIVLILLAGPIALGSPLAQAADGTPSYVAGTVLDEKGNPLEGIVVEGRSYAPESGNEVGDRNVTDANGAFRLTLGEGKTWVSAYNEKTGRTAETSTYLEPGQTAEVKLTIESPPPKDAIVTGVVRGVDGKPIANAQVTLGGACCYMAQPEPAPMAGETTAESSSGSAEPSGDEAHQSSIAPIRCCYDDGYAETYTDDEGRYRLESYEGPRQLSASAKGYAQTTISIDLRSGQTVTQDIDLEKVPDATATFEGRVVDAKTGLPIRGAWIYLSNLEWNRYESAQSDRDGRFSVTTIPGWVQISIQPPSTCCGDPMPVEDGVATKIAASNSPEYRGFLKAFQLADGKSTQEFKLIPKPAATIVLTGYVVDPNTKKAVPDAWVNMWNQDSGDWGNARTDATGSYKFVVRPGVHQITAYADGYLSGADTTVVDASDTVKRVDIQMPKGTAKYAPCDPCYREIAYSESTPAGHETVASRESSDSTAPPQPAAAPMASDSKMTAGGNADSGGTRASTYEGSGGGLPPYDPADGQTIPAAEQAANVPAVGILGVIVAGLVVLAFRRRS